MFFETNDRIGCGLDEKQAATIFQYPMPAIFYSHTTGLYYTVRGPQNTENMRAVPAPSPEYLLESQPVYFFTPHGTSCHVFVAEVLSAYQIRVAANASVPDVAPFYVLVTELEDVQVYGVENVQQLKVTRRLKVVLAEWDVWTFDKPHNLTAGGNTPILYFTRKQTIRYNGTEQELPHTYFSACAHNSFVKDPLEVWAYAYIYGWSWGWPLPFAENTCDTSVEVNDRAVVYGYDSARVFQQLIFSFATGYWKFTGHDCYPIVQNAAISAPIERAFVEQSTGFVFKHGTGYETRRCAVYARRW